MALPPKFKGHRLTFTDASTSSPSNEPLHTLEFYLDYVCPFSAKLFRTLTVSVIPHLQSNPALASKLQLIIRQQIQPWHPSSTLVHETALAVQRLTNGDATKFWALSGALFFNQAQFFDEAVAHESRNETYRRLAKFAAEFVEGVDEEEVYKLLEIKEGGEAKNVGNAVTGDVKTVVKMARQMGGVHVTPTVVFDGVVVGEIGSAWTKEQWVEWLEKNVV